MDKSDQLGLIAYFAKRLGSKNRLGRKAFQKIVHIATELGKVSTGYHFSFYTYGPYSRELATDLELAEMLGGIVSSQDLSGGGYDIKAGTMGDTLIEQSEFFLMDNEKRLDSIIEYFGGHSAWTLELFSTLIFLKNREPIVAGNENILIARAKQLKPKYELADITAAYTKLQETESMLRSRAQ